MKLTAVGFDEQRVYPIPVPFKADRARWCASISTVMQSAGIAQLRCLQPVVSGVSLYRRTRYRAFMAKIPTALTDLQQGLADTLGELMATIGISEMTLDPENGELDQMEKFWGMTVQAVAPARKDTDPSDISILETKDDRPKHADGSTDSANA